MDLTHIALLLFQRLLEILEVEPVNIRRENPRQRQRHAERLV